MLALSQTSPSQAASKREQLVLLADAFAGLPDAEADVLWLYVAEDLSFEAIGERLGLSRKSVRGIFARGLKHLKRHDGGAARRSPEVRRWSIAMTTRNRSTGTSGPNPTTRTTSSARRSRNTSRWPSGTRPPTSRSSWPGTPT